ncbi:MAG: hypothetical protein RSE13_03735 [Planktothrix sp. GU0601_MAG3]|nr:MAG: hypothetical protein RSE13_03735 [Planktothrix sp. GU0601_MAG3]
MTFSQGDLSPNNQQQGISSQKDSSDQVESDSLELLIDLLMDLNGFNEVKAGTDLALTSEDQQPGDNSESNDLTALSLEDSQSNIVADLPLENQPSIDSVKADEIPSKIESIQPIPVCLRNAKSGDDLILRLLPLLEKPPSGAMDVDYSVSNTEEDLPRISSHPLPKLETSENRDSTEDISTRLPLEETESDPVCNSNNPLEKLQELMFGCNLGNDLESFKSHLLDSELPEVRELVRNINNKLSQVQFQINDPEQLIELLLPSIGQLLKLKVIESKDELIQAFIPIIDQVIKGKGQTDRQAMSEAIADLIPEAIKQQIKNSPKEIAQALGPEMGAAIREQIKVDRNEIAAALAPMIGRSIKETGDFRTRFYGRCTVSGNWEHH